GARTKERFGMHYIIDVLPGANTQRIRDYGHDQLSTYGIGKEQSVDEWLHLGRALLQQGLVSETADMRPVLRLNALSKEILRRQREVQIAVRPVSTAARKEKADESVPDLDAESARLFNPVG